MPTRFSNRYPVDKMKKESCITQPYVSVFVKVFSESKALKLKEINVSKLMVNLSQMVVKWLTVL